MRIQSIDEGSNPEDVAPWAAIIVAVEGGWIAFESVTDYEVWSRQV